MPTSFQGREKAERRCHPLFRGRRCQPLFTRLGASAIQVSPYALIVVSALLGRSTGGVMNYPSENPAIHSQGEGLSEGEVKRLRKTARAIATSPEGPPP